MREGLIQVELVNSRGESAVYWIPAAPEVRPGLKLRLRETGSEHPTLTASGRRTAQTNGSYLGLGEASFLLPVMMSKLQTATRQLSVMAITGIWFAPCEAGRPLSRQLAQI